MIEKKIEDSVTYKIVLTVMNKLLNESVPYAIQQYGDADSDLISTWEPQRCIEEVQKYLKRFGKNVRPGQEKNDILKSIMYLIRLYYMNIEVTESIEQKLLKKINENKDYLPEDIKNEIKDYFSDTNTNT